jgi:hypothetical protein
MGVALDGLADALEKDPERAEAKATAGPTSADPFRGMFSYDGSFIPDCDSLVIDPEAANPMLDNLAARCKSAAEAAPEEIVQTCQVQAAEEVSAKTSHKSAKSSSSITSNSKQERISTSSDEPSDPSSPGLDIVIGYWKDEKDSHYEVYFDPGSTTSCHVKTTRPGGLVRETSALIRRGQFRGKSAGRIIWGSAFVLKTPVESPSNLHWKSMRNGKDFSWTRVDDGAARRDGKEAVAKKECLEASSCVNPPGSVEEVQEPIPSGNGLYSTSWTSRTRRRVWRAVVSKTSVDRDVRAGSTVITPSEVAAAPCRWVQSHSGEWRVIKKGPRK